MYATTSEYKEQMDRPIRNASYMRIALGLINQNAQQSAEVENQSQYTLYSDFLTIFTNNSVGNVHATYEQNFFKADGMMRFLPRSESSYRKNGITTTELFPQANEIKFSFDGSYSIHGLTIQFGDNYPTEFTVETSDGTEVEFQNNSALFVTDEVFESTDTITIHVTSMRYPNNRIRIYYIKFGQGLEFDDEWIETTTSKSTLSMINEDLPEVTFSVTLKNEDQRFNVDNPSSEINFLESGQNLSVSWGYELDSGRIEWIKLHTLYVTDWSADDSTATINASDIMKFMSEKYYKGYFPVDTISLYTLADLVLQDAGFSFEDYYLDPYLGNVEIKNPIPYVTHSEALQLIANAGRCVLTYDRNGKISIRHVFIPDYVFSSNGTAYYSDVSAIDNENEKTLYATYAQDYWKADGSMMFVPRSGVQESAGYVSDQISGPDGTFEEKPVITQTLEASWSSYGIRIRFSRNLPSGITLKTYLDYSPNAVISITEGITEDFYYVGELGEFDTIEIQFDGTTVPNNRIQVDYLTIEDETNYKVKYDDLYSTPIGAQLEGVRNLNVVSTIYSEGTEDTDLTNDTFAHDGTNRFYYFSEPCHNYSASVEEGAGMVSIVSSGAYYVELAVGAGVGIELKIKISGRKYNKTESTHVIAVNEKGTDITWTNPLISSNELCKEVGEWIADYYASRIEYELDFRGEPALDCGDTIFQENKYVENLKTVIEEHQMTFNGAVKGALRTRRKSRVDRT